MILLEMPKMYNSARKHLTFFGGGKIKAVYYKEAVDCTIKYVFVSKTALGGRNTENKINGGI